MRYLDFKKGKIFGVNVVDLAVLFLVLYLAFSFGSKIISPKLTFGGEQMYSAITTHQKLDTKGFLVEAEVRGRWVKDDTEFRRTGLLVSSKGGALRLKMDNGDLVSVGGSMAYVEDVAAEEILFKPLDRYIVSFSLEPLSFDDYPSFVSYLEELKRELSSEHLYVTLDLALDAPMKQSDVQKLTNEIESMYLLRDFFLMRTGEGGAIVTLNRVEVGELHKLKVTPEKVTTSRVDVVAGFEAEPSAPRVGNEPVADYHLSRLEDWT